ncbi:hypothetical protein BJY01DRAFT_221278, partial [Aspergillus pseudoustus]
MHSRQPTGTLIPDVWYLIIAILCESSTPEKRNVSNNAGHTDVPTSLAKQTPDLRDLVALSSTCSWFRTLLAPRLFRTICLHNTEKNALAVQAIGEGKSSGYVKELQYNCTYMGTWDEEDASRLEEIYPPELSTLLSNLACFDGLERLEINFVWGGDRSIWDILSDELMDDFNSDAGVAEERAEYEPWRDLMASSFRAIASNYDPQRYPSGTTPNLPRALNIRELAPTTLPTYYEPVWGHFLSHIKHFTMTIPYLDNGAGWCVITQPAYSGFTEYLGPWFFQHLSAAESISFDPAETGTLGDTGDARFDSSIGLHDANMPNLRSVNFGNLVLCDELLKFLVRHIGTLESITLRDCYGFERVFYEEGHLRWKHLFKSLIAASPSQLKSFEIINEDQDDKNKLLFLDSPWADKQLVDRAMTKIKNEPDVRPFPYAYLNDKYGFRAPDFDTTVECFLGGDDDRLYKEVMAVVERNAKAKRLKD